MFIILTLTGRAGWRHPQTVFIAIALEPFPKLAYVTYMYLPLIFAFFILSDVTDHVPGVFLGHKRFFVNNLDQIELENRAR